MNETLISKREVPFTYVLDDYVYIIPIQQNNTLDKEHSSANAEWMNKKEMEDLIWNE